jgi:hypothetical protein
MSRDADNEFVMLDATIVRAHQHSAGRSRGGLTTKIHAAVDALGNPVALSLGNHGLGREVFEQRLGLRYIVNLPRRVDGAEIISRAGRRLPVQGCASRESSLSRWRATSGRTRLRVQKTYINSVAGVFAPRFKQKPAWQHPWLPINVCSVLHRTD